MQVDPRYDDAPREVFNYLKERVGACEKAGIARARIAVDPGIGFGKTLEHNLQILSRLDIYRELGCAVLLGLSRKSFIGKLSRGESPKARVPGSVAAALAALRLGVRLFRVHDVAETVQAFHVWQAIETGGAGPD
jgi:dihydropteroate synthase